MGMNSILYKTIGFHPGIPVEKLKQKYTTPESQFLCIEGMQVHFRKTGKGPALLLIHGIGSSLHTWKEYHELLSDSFTVVSLDIPGFGLTGPTPNQQYNFELYSRVFAGLLDHLKIEKAHVAGNSLGGILTWQFALLQPERILKIVLMDAVGFNTKFSELADFGFRLAAHPNTKKLTYKVLPLTIVASSLKNAVYNPNLVTPQKINQYAELLLRKGNREAFSQILTQLIVTEEDHTQKIRTIKHPTLIMWGEEDNLISVNDVQLFKRAIPHAQVVVYPKIGHLPMEENPEQSAADIKKFLIGQ
jgi:pimeloyl-ACP methyl ester carboxylesterase